MEIHFQTSDHVVAVEIVAEQHIGTKLCSCNTFEDISHLLIMVIIKVAITQLAMELQLWKFTAQWSNVKLSIAITQLAMVLHLGHLTMI